MGQKLGLTRLSEPAPADPADVARSLPPIVYAQRWRSPDTGERAKIFVALNQKARR
jgi:hypothetical protein